MLQVAGLGCVLGLFSLMGAAVFPIVLQTEVFASLLCHTKPEGRWGTDDSSTLRSLHRHRRPLVFTLSFNLPVCIIEWTESPRQRAPTALKARDNYVIFDNRRHESSQAKEGLDHSLEDYLVLDSQLAGGYAGWASSQSNASIQVTRRFLLVIV